MIKREIKKFSDKFMLTLIKAKIIKIIARFQYSSWENLLKIFTTHSPTEPKAKTTVCRNCCSFETREIALKQQPQRDYVWTSFNIYFTPNIQCKRLSSPIDIVYRVLSDNFFFSNAFSLSGYFFVCVCVCFVSFDQKVETKCRFVFAESDCRVDAIGPHAECL